MSSLHRLVIALLLALPLAVSAQSVVVSGFEPFGGRNKNASWTLVSEIKKAFPGIHAQQVPVVWGAPLKTISSISPSPAVWIAFGEGTPTFQVEIVAHNVRGQFKDNDKKLPPTPEIVTGGAPELRNAVDAATLAKHLTQAGFPTRVSQNAGQYLCEEMLYSLLHSQKQHPDAFKTVLFIHVPVLGQKVDVPGAKAGEPSIKRSVDDAWLKAFGLALGQALKQTNLADLTAAK